MFPPMRYGDPVDWSDSPPMVATVIHPSERPRIEAAAGGCFCALHTASIKEAIRTVRERPVNAVLISPRSVGPDQLASLARFMRVFPSVPAVAVVSRHDPDSSARLLELGATGVRRMVDLSVRDGWQILRDLVTQPTSPIAAAILAKVLPPLEDSTPGAWHFARAVVCLAPATPTVRLLSRRLGLRATTFMSRFFRASLPSPKQYLATMRLVHAAALFETRGLSIADVAYRLEFSSPQSFGRHVREMLGITAGEFRQRFSFDTALDDYVARLIVPHRTAYAIFDPLEQGVMDYGHEEMPEEVREGTMGGSFSEPMP